MILANGWKIEYNDGKAVVSNPRDRVMYFHQPDGSTAPYYLAERGSLIEQFVGKLGPRDTTLREYGIYGFLASFR